MPVILAALLVIVAVLLASVLLIPVAIVQRYRAGTMRRQARAWLATINLAGLTLSIAVFLVSAALTSIWINDALLFAGAGVGAGLLVGVLGLALTRWEPRPGALFYTPNRWLVLAITTAVAARILYGFWRMWEQWRALGGDWTVVSSGVAGSLAAGALILGYYWTYWFGVRRRAIRARS